MLGTTRILLIPLASLIAFIFLFPDISYLQQVPRSTGNGSNSREEISLVEIGGAPKTRHLATLPETIKVISYNIRWRGGDELREMISLFKNDAEIGGATILGLQEVDRNKRRTKHTNTVKWIAEELGMHYAWAAPPNTKPGQEEETGVAILSYYPLADIQRIVLPHKGPGGRRRVALGATVMIGDIPLRFYSVHSETRLAVHKKLDQMRAVLNDLDKYPKDMGAIVLGDLNTWERSAVKRTAELFRSANFRTPFDNGKSTFFRKVLLLEINLKLDWIWLRGFDSAKHGIERDIELSDHWPLWTVIRLDTNNRNSGPSSAK